MTSHAALRTRVRGAGTTLSRDARDCYGQWTYATDVNTTGDARDTGLTTTTERRWNAANSSVRRRRAVRRATTTRRRTADATDGRRRRNAPRAQGVRGTNVRRDRQRDARRQTGGDRRAYETSDGWQDGAGERQNDGLDGRGDDGTKKRVRRTRR
ncbi:hypothetical protein JTE90_012053 [Oedothorax gibbosus]|uniref:Uncharacterized protein n=1 Tax=Oedothorax gibbosus TaxID=931172 RepID=A0AAV6TES6_9ARAC|nr:hypothetical protein JTE90_012053 [Oedothorax gibbosus]